MPIVEKLPRYLDESHVRYEPLSHPRAYTAQEIAALQHVKGRDFAKVVMAVTSAGPVMVVLPATRRLDLLKLAVALASDRAPRLAHEDEFAHLFAPCEPGAMPPFGNLFGVPIYVDRSLATEEVIVFQAGTHADTVRMRYADFARLAHPVVGDFTLLRDEEDLGAAG
jgi:Ala-tRNA(Pro) deacylase